MPIIETVRAFGIVVLVLAASSLSGADDNKPVPFKSPIARAAKTRFAARLAEIERDAETKTALARKEYVVELQKAKEDATHRADLDEAVRIRDELASVQKGDPTRPAPLSEWKARESLVARLAGTTWTIPGNSRLILKADGTSPRPDGKQGRWAAIGDRAIMVTYEDGWADLWEFDEQLAKAKVVHARLGEPVENNRMP